MGKKTPIPELELTEHQLQMNVDIQQQYEDLLKRKIKDPYMTQIQIKLQKKLEELLESGIEQKILDAKSELEPKLEKLEAINKRFVKKFMWRTRVYKRDDKKYGGLEPLIKTRWDSTSRRKINYYEYPNTLIPNEAQIAYLKKVTWEMDGYKLKIRTLEQSLYGLYSQIKMYAKVNGNLNDNTRQTTKTKRRPKTDSGIKK